MRLRLLAGIIPLGALALGMVDARANSWPPKPGADMSDPSNWPNDPGYTSDWNYWSWMPQQIPGTRPYLSADTMLGASGMHVDQAWRYTTGRADVHIAVIDCGIEWDGADLVNRALLNASELSSHRPESSDGTLCPAVDAMQPALGWDCEPQDGVFTVADYLNDPRIAPMVPTTRCGTGGMTLKGDVNQNCILDAGDLIQLFSDRIDDDNNGYTDDISGWDFYKNDNNPYDDTRYGHGTSVAATSSDEGNNSMGDIGVCPDCRFVMLRAGDSSIADATDLAKGVVYAADNGFKVVEDALETIDQTAFSKAAIDYAYGHGVAVVATMGDDNSRHHHMPGATDHTLRVHSMKNDSTVLGPANGKVQTNATTFLDFDTCSNYGAQNMLSISAGSCSSEATGRAAGIAGLLFSEGTNKNLSLSPEEVMQLMTQSTDVVNVPESRSPNPSVAGNYYESLPYFSQRFAYGRPNVERAMEAIDAGKIPPEVDITSPAWFDVLYADRVTAPVPLVATVAAKRATAYDYKVEWAPGVEPAESLFQTLSDWVRNVPASTVSGGADSPLAMLAPGQLNTTHIPDPDSKKFGENDRTITVRVTAVAHYGGGDVTGQARRSIAIVNALPPSGTGLVDGGQPDAHNASGPPVEAMTHNGLDEDLAKGFPVALGASMESSPKLADIDGDGVRDIVAAASDGSVHVFSLRSGVPKELPGFPFYLAVIDGLNPSLGTTYPTVPSYLESPAYKNGAVDTSIARESIVATPAIGDINGDGKSEIVISSYEGTVYVIDSHGQMLQGWPKRLPLVASCLQPQTPGVSSDPPCMDEAHKWSRGALASPVLADFDLDGRPEIIQATFDGNIHVWHGDGSELAGWPVAVHALTSTTSVQGGQTVPEYNRIVSTPAVADFNGDGIPDLVTGSNEKVYDAGNIFLIDGRGMNTPGGQPYFKDWPIIIPSRRVLPLVAEGTPSAPAIGDFTGSGHPEILVQGNGPGVPFLFPRDPGPQTGMNEPPNRLPIYRTDAGTQIGFYAPSMFGAGTRAFQPDTMVPLFSHPAIGDLDEDGVPDAITGGGSIGLLGVGTPSSGYPPKTQHLLAMWSGATGHMMYGSPVPIEDYTLLQNETVADITGDGYPEVLVATGGYFVHAVDACGCEAPRWPKFTDGWVIPTAAVGDINGDHTLEVVSGTRDGYLFAWHTPGTDTGVVQWESFHHDNGNTGNYAAKLDQGQLRVTSQPIACAMGCQGATSSSSSSGGGSGLSPVRAGGCGCRVVSSDTEHAGTFFAALMAGLGAVVSRRRRRR